MLNHDRLTTPATDGEVLVEPAARTWRDLIAANVTLRERSGVRIAGRSAGELADHTRHQLYRGIGGVPPAALPSGTIIACGHQPAFVHPGVWVKHAAVRRAAEAWELAGLDLVVDNDAPVSGSLRVPQVGEDGLVGERQTAMMPGGSSGSAYEGRAALSAKEIDRFARAMSEALGERFAASAMPGYLEGLRGAGAEDFVDQHLCGRRRVDDRLGVEVPESRVSEAFGGPFVGHLLADAAGFADAYNAALGDYRRAQGVRGVNRPLPDLMRDADRVETPFWVYRPRERRRRLLVAAEGARLRLFGDREEIGAVARDDLLHDADGALASIAPWRVRPRALTLTLWARLLVCDLFVHGIGGAKYERITDGIFRRYFRCEPPAYACVSATLRLPLPLHGVGAAEAARARRDLRDLRFNPQRHLVEAPRELIAERSRLVETSQQLREQRGDRLERRRIWQALRQINQRLLDARPDAFDQARTRLDLIRQQAASDTVANSREFFYCLQPCERLAALAAKVAEAMGLPSPR